MRQSLRLACVLLRTAVSDRYLIALFSLMMSCMISALAGAQPLRLSNQFVLNSLHLSMRPDQALIISPEAWHVDANVSVTNSYLSNDAFVVDLEQRDVDFELRYGVVEGFEVSLGLPLHWRGGGTFDHTIREWHDIFDLPEGDREHVTDDQYIVSGETRDGTFAIEDHGFGFGNARLRVKQELWNTSSTRLSAAMTIGFPTARPGFGQDGIDALGEVLWGWSQGGWSVESGIGALLMTDRVEQGLHYRWLNAESFLSSRYKGWDPVSVYVGIYAGTQSVENVRSLSDAFLYLDTGIEYELANNRRCGVWVRENPYPSRASADVSIVLRCSVLWGH